MPKYIAFLRAINVGDRTVKMDHLRRLFEGLGFSGVETFIASGNVIFESTARDPKALEKRIENHLQAALGFPVSTFLRSPAELKAAAGRQPFKETEGCMLYVAFTAGPPADPARRKLQTFAGPIDQFHVHGREVYWLCRKSLGDSRFSGALLEKTLGAPATVRNVTTLRKMALRYG